MYRIGAWNSESCTAIGLARLAAELTQPRGSANFDSQRLLEKHAIAARIQRFVRWRLAIVDEIVNEHSPQKNVSGDDRAAGTTMYEDEKSQVLSMYAASRIHGIRRVKITNV
jgi:hypothetical protein